MYNPYANSEPVLNSRGAAHTDYNVPPQVPNIQQPHPQYYGNQQPQQQQPQHPSQSVNPQQQQQAGQFSNIFNSTQANLGFQFTQGALNMAQQNVSSYIPKENLKTYFKVDNNYVYKKLSLLVFPYRNNKWSRTIAAQQNSATDKLIYSPPTEDTNAPDLYIPLMGFITIILITSVVLGINGEFNPQILSLLFSKEIAIYILDFVVLWAGFFIFNIQEYKYYDILSYTGYKFVPISILLLSRNLLASNWIYYLTFVYFLVSYGVFLIRSMRSIVFPNGNIGGKSRTKEISIFVYSFAIQALLFMII